MRRLSLFLVLLTLSAPSIVHAAPTIGSVTPITATAGVPVNLSATVSSVVAIASCTLWVDLAEIGTMTVSGGLATRVYTFPNGGSRIAFVFCRDTLGGMSAGATTAITVSGTIQNTAPLATSPSSGSGSSQTNTPTLSQPVSTTPTTNTTTSTPTTQIQPEAPQAPSSDAGRLLKATCPARTDADHPCRSVYYIGKDGKRHAFPNSRVFFTWYAGFDAVEEVSTSALSAFPLGTNVQYRAGVRMVKFTTDPKVYAVARGGVLRWVRTEALAQAYYGEMWNTKIDDIPDSFYTNYSYGDVIDDVEDYNPEMEFENSTE